jgi:2-polyprenyl-6-hydroxyphenyl methylase/3-demethylubiquinone-9 3-methyltransferase
VRELLGEHVEFLRCERASVVVDHFVCPADLCEYYKRHFGPTIAAYAAAEDRRAELDRDFLEFAERWYRGGTYEYEYLLVVATRGSG